MTLEMVASPQPIATEDFLSYEEFVQEYAGCHAEWEVGKAILIVNNTQHQRILSFLLTLFNFYLGIHKVGEAFPAGMQMFLGKNLPAREPDLLIILNKHKDRIKETRLEGPADLVIEIVSPESRERDYSAKFEEYEAAQVTEYWIIDPDRRIVDVHCLGEDGLYTRLPTDTQGYIISSLLPHFALDPKLLWVEPLPTGLEVVALVQAMGV